MRSSQQVHVFAIRVPPYLNSILIGKWRSENTRADCFEVKDQFYSSDDERFAMWFQLLREGGRQCVVVLQFHSSDDERFALWFQLLREGCRQCVVVLQFHSSDDERFALWFQLLREGCRQCVVALQFYVLMSTFD
jgi:hypothetical protein